MKKEIGQAPAADTAEFIARFDLRSSILEEERLRRSIERDERSREARPGVWRICEEARRAENREIAKTNRRLRAIGLEPVRLQPSLSQCRQELQRLQQSNEAKIAAFQKRSEETGVKPRGTPLARRRSGRTDR